MTGAYLASTCPNAAYTFRKRGQFFNKGNDSDKVEENKSTCFFLFHKKRINEQYKDIIYLLQVWQQQQQQRLLLAVHPGQLLLRLPCSPSTWSGTVRSQKTVACAHSACVCLRMRVCTGMLAVWLVPSLRCCLTGGRGSRPNSRALGQHRCT